MSSWGWAWTIGATFGFEFIDEDFMGGGFVLHVGFFKVLYFKNVPVEPEDYYDPD